MATITENKKNGRTTSYRFVVCLGRDPQNKKIRRTMTWTPPEGMTPSKARKAAERAADTWEQDIKEAYHQEQAALLKGQAYILPPEKRKDDFVSFVNDTWLALYICNGDRKKTTIAYYEDIAKYITAYFKDTILQEIDP